MALCKGDTHNPSSPHLPSAIHTCTEQLSAGLSCFFPAPGSLPTSFPHCPREHQGSSALLASVSQSLTQTTVWLSLSEYPRPTVSGLHLCILSSPGLSAPSCISTSWAPCVLPLPHPPDLLRGVSWLLLPSLLDPGAECGLLFLPQPPALCHFPVTALSLSLISLSSVYTPGSSRAGTWLFIAEFPAKDPEHSRYSVSVG